MVADYDVNFIHLSACSQPVLMLRGFQTALIISMPVLHPLNDHQ
jgi:hypothetical protein